MKILDPLTGQLITIEADIVPFETFRQRSLNRQMLKRPLTAPKPVPVLTKEWDDEACQPVDTVYVGRDPGDEN